MIGPSILFSILTLPLLAQEPSEARGFPHSTPPNACGLPILTADYREKDTPPASYRESATG
jgi:hypothetical protein